MVLLTSHPDSWRIFYQEFADRKSLRRKLYANFALFQAMMKFIHSGLKSKKWFSRKMIAVLEKKL
jgi:hypothetical protein